MRELLDSRAREHSRAGEPIALAELARIVPGRSAELVFHRPLQLSATWKSEIQALLSAAFNQHEVERVVAFLDSGESQAIRVLNRSGFEFQRTQWSNPSRGPFQIFLVYELTKSRWSECREAPPSIRSGVGSMLRNLGVKLRLSMPMT